MTCRGDWWRLRWNQVQACYDWVGRQTDTWHYLPLPEGEPRAIAITPGREGGRPGGWCRTGTLGKPSGRIWGSSDHGGTGDSGGQGGYGDSGGHGGSGASGGHGGYGDSGGHGGYGDSGGHGGSGALGDHGGIIPKVPFLVTMATRTTGIFLGGSPAGGHSGSADALGR